MNAFRTGLATMLIGAFALSCNQQEPVAEKKGPMSSLDSLAAMVEQEQSSAVAPAASPAQESFVSPYGEYSLARSPEEFGFRFNKHLGKDGMYDFQDQYKSTNGSLAIVRLSLDPSIEATLEAVYNGQSENTGMMMLGMLNSSLPPGGGYEIKGMGPAKNFSVDGMQGLHGGAEFWMYSGEDDRLSHPRNDYTDKITLHDAVLQDDNKFYIFNLTYVQDGGASDRRTEELYKEVLKSFDALK